MGFRFCLNLLTLFIVAGGLTAAPVWGAEVVRLPWNSPRQEFGASLSASGNLYFYSNRDKADTDLYVSRRENGSFGEPKPLAELNSQFDDQSPFILPDESGIIFSSNRDGSHELRTERGIAVSRDLYFARKTSSGWAAPELLPDEVNTAMIEENPFMHGKRLFFVRYPFAHPELAKIYFSDISEAGWSQAREFPVRAITPGVFGNRFYFARASENGKYQIAFIALGDLNLPNLADRIQVRQDLDTDADEASYAAGPDNAVVVFCRRSSTGDYDLFELRGDPWEQGEAFSLTGILFDSNKATILPASGELLDRLAAYLKQKQTGILVTGHADRTGDAALNMSLSARRAESVKAALMSRGVPAARIRTEGKGATEPVDPSNTEEAYAKNRRTEFRFIDN